MWLIATRRFLVVKLLLCVFPLSASAFCTIPDGAAEAAFTVPHNIIRHAATQVQTQKPPKLLPSSRVRHNSYRNRSVVIESTPTCLFSSSGPTPSPRTSTTSSPTPNSSSNNRKKELAYDESSGRFFEASSYTNGKEREECIDPDEDEFCAVDKSSGKLIRLTIEEKERIFLDSVQTYYSSGRQLLSDAEFDLLKEDLTWAGSSMVVMNRKEAAYLNAMQEYLKGSPTLTNSEFDQLKQELMTDGSKFAVQTEPKCYIDTGICKVTLQEDRFRSNLLYLPSTLLLLLAWLGVGFELIEPVVRLNPLVLILLGAYPIYLGSKFITEEIIFQNKLVAYGPCPNCNYQNRIYFGNILGVEGFDAVAEVKCPNCRDVFRVQRDTLRASTLPKL